jgi:hypothetical protein
LNQWSLFKEMWNLTVRNRSLWFFGALPIVISIILSLAFQSVDQATLFGSSPTLSPLIMLWVAALVVQLAVQVFSDAALFGMVSQLQSGEAVSINDGARVGVRRSAPLLIVRLLLSLPLAVVVLWFTGSLLAGISSIFGGAGNILSSVLSDASVAIVLATAIILISLLFEAIGIGAERAIVLEDSSVLPALSRGWSLLLRNFKDYLLIGLIFLALSLGIAVVFSFGLGPLLQSILPASGTATDATASGPAALILTLINLILSVLTSIFTAGVWTLAFRGWQANEPAPVSTSSD